MSRFLSAIATIFGGAALLAGLTMPVAGAEPAPGQSGSGRTLVVMGDSQTTNATWETSQPQPVGKACPRLPTSWPTQLAQRMGLWDNKDIEDVSCVGSYIYRHGDDPYWTALTQARAAAAAGGFGTRTQAVLLQFGFNDAWGNADATQAALLPCLLNVARGCSTADAAADGHPSDPLTAQVYLTHLKDIVTYIRFYAPNARIVLVGYQEMHTPGDQSLCTNIQGVPLTIPRAGAITDIYDSVQTAPRAAAPLLGIEFFDVAAVTAGHGLCSKDPWLNGYLTPGRDFMGQPGHPTVQGDTVVSQALQQYLAAPRPA